MVRSWSLGDPSRKIIQGVGPPKKEKKRKNFPGFEIFFLLLLCTSKTQKESKKQYAGLLYKIYSEKSNNLMALKGTKKFVLLF